MSIFLKIAILSPLKYLKSFKRFFKSKKPHDFTENWIVLDDNFNSFAFCK